MLRLLMFYFATIASARVAAPVAVLQNTRHERLLRALEGREQPVKQATGAQLLAASGFCATQCCLARAVSATDDLHAFRRWLSSRPERVAVAVVGNSVARSNAFSVAKGLAAAVRAYAGERCKVTLSYQTVHGGFEPENLYECGLPMTKAIDADVILIQYEIFAVKRRAEELVRAMLTLPRRPLVVLVSHCMLEDFLPTHSQFSYRNAHDTERELARAYGLPFVGTGDALRSILNVSAGAKGVLPGDGGPCDGEPAYVASLEAMLRTFFAVKPDGSADTIHYGPGGAALQVRLLAHLLLDADDRTQDHEAPVSAMQYATGWRGNGTTVPTLPARMVLREDELFFRGQPPYAIHGSDSAHGAPAYCLQTGKPLFDQVIVDALSNGWTRRKGGAGGAKTWYEASKVGATIEFSLPSAAFVALVVYVHHDLPMGMLLATLGNGTERIVIDTCCAQECVAEAAGQGLYKTVWLNELPLREKDRLPLRLEVIARPGKSACAKDGNFVSISALYGHVLSVE